MDLSWSRVYLELECLRARRGRKEPSAAVFQSLFKNAFEKTNPGEGVKFVFHSPVDYNRLYEGRRYPFFLIFNTPAPEVGEKMIPGLQEFLEEQKTNSKLPFFFSLVRWDKPEVRWGEKVIAGLQPENREELTLLFHSPLNLRGQSPRASRTEITGQELMENFSRRIKSFLGQSPGIAQAPETVCCYWEYTEKIHITKSSPGTALLNGFKGPLGLKKITPGALEVIAVCSEIHGGDRTSYGLGFFTIEKKFSFFDEKITNQRFIRKTMEKMTEKGDGDPAFLELLLEGGAVENLTTKLTGDYVHAPYDSIEAAGPVSGPRWIFQSSPEDFIIERLIETAVTPVWNRLWEKSSFSRGKVEDKEKALAEIKHKIDEGFSWIFTANLEAFYEELSWDCLFNAIKKILPGEDRITYNIIEEIVKAPVMRGDERIERDRGLPVGSPVTPLLGNLMLDPFDEEMESRGCSFVRFREHLLLFARDRKEAERWRDMAVSVLRGLGININNMEEKKVISREEGFTFLGHHFNSSLDSQLVSESLLLKSLYIQREGAFAGLEGEKVVVKEGKKIIARLPFNRIKEIIILGNAAVSTALLHQCSGSRVPVTFCSGRGYHVNTLRPDSRTFHLMSGQHYLRYEELKDDEFLSLGKRLIQAKLENYAAYFSLRQSPPSALKSLKEILLSLEEAATLQKVLGYEGAGEKIVYSLINEHLLVKEFQSPGRRRKKPDPLNALLNFASYLLFTRLNALVRCRGLNPYLGFLHSKGDDYESLVCDLMEPFRFRLTRLILRMINRKEITTSDFVEKDKGWWLTYRGTRAFIQGFEGELASTIKGDPGHGEALLEAQVLSVLHWVQWGVTIKIYRRGGDEVQ